jgi:hypothetical protein
MNNKPLLISFTLFLALTLLYYTKPPEYKYIEVPHDMFVEIPKTKFIYIKVPKTVINGDLTITGNISIEGDLFVNGNAIILGATAPLKLRASKSIEISDCLFQNTDVAIKIFSEKFILISEKNNLKFTSNNYNVYSETWDGK